jgi:hypothetical protein
MTSCLQSFRKKVNDGEENCTVRCLIIYSLHQNATRKIEGFFFSLTDKRRPEAQAIFYYTFCYYQRGCLSSSRHQLFGQSVGPVLIGQAGEKTLYIIKEKKLRRKAHTEGMRKIHNFGRKPEGK